MDTCRRGKAAAVRGGIGLLVFLLMALGAACGSHAEQRDTRPVHVQQTGVFGTGEADAPVTSAPESTSAPVRHTTTPVVQPPPDGDDMTTTTTTSSREPCIMIYPPPPGCE